jgi:hypothetical protein
MVSDSGLVLEKVHSGSKTYRRVGSFESYLSDWTYEHWLKNLVRSRFYPSITSNLEDVLASGFASRDASFDISELDIFDNITQDLERLSQENDSSGADAPERRSTSADAVDSYILSFNGMRSSPVTQGAKLDRLASLIRCLRLFNGTEEEAEIEIV